MIQQKIEDEMNVSEIANESIEVDAKSSDDDDGDISFMKNRINPNKYFGLFRGYIRSDYYEDELRASWVELFYDLIFVACIVHLAYEGVYSLPSEDSTYRRLASSEDSTSEDSAGNNSDCYQYSFLLTTFIMFGLFSTFWIEQVMYITHFEFNQIGDEIVRVIYMTMILSMGVFIGNYPSYHMAFMISYAILRFCSLFMYFKALLIPRAKWHATWHIILYFIILNITIYLVLSMHYQLLYSYCATPYFLMYCILFMLESFGRAARLLVADRKIDLVPSIKMKMNIPHIAERYGLFVMIILGESLISIMTADIGELDISSGFKWTDDHIAPDIIQIFFILATFILSYLIGRLYYNCQPSEEHIMKNQQHHALGRKNRVYSRIYQFAHQILFVGLFGYGVGIKIAAKHLLSEKRYWIDVLIPGYSIVLIVICLNIIRCVHPFHDQNYMALYKNVWRQRIIIIIIISIVPLCGNILNQGLLFGIIFVCILLLVIIDIEGQSKIKLEKKEAKERRQEDNSEDIEN